MSGEDHLSFSPRRRHTRFEPLHQKSNAVWFESVLQLVHEQNRVLAKPVLLYGEGREALGPKTPKPYRDGAVVETEHGSPKVKPRHVEAGLKFAEYRAELNCRGFGCRRRRLEFYQGRLGHDPLCLARDFGEGLRGRYIFGRELGQCRTACPCEMLLDVIAQTRRTESLTVLPTDSPWLGEPDFAHSPARFQILPNRKAHDQHWHHAIHRIIHGAFGRIITAETEAKLFRLDDQLRRQFANGRLDNNGIGGIALIEIGVGDGNI